MANENRTSWLLISLPVEEPILKNWMNEKVMTETRTTLVIPMNFLKQQQQQQPQPQQWN